MTTSKHAATYSNSISGRKLRHYYSAGAHSPSSRGPAWHVAWQGAASTSGHNAIDVPAQLAKLLGIADGLVCYESHINHIPRMLSEDDFLGCESLGILFQHRFLTRCPL